MTDQLLYDIAITGGGVGGLTLAIQAARAGYSVILFEKNSYPFHRVCGEYISNESRQFLIELGLPVKAMKLPEISELLLTDLSGREYSFPLNKGGFGISRFHLDFVLYSIAADLGVRFYTDTKVLDIHFKEEVFTLHTSRGIFSSRTAVGSFGKHSNLEIQRKRSNPLKVQREAENYIGVKYHIRYLIPSNRIALHNFEQGYCGISMVEAGICCLCYLTTAANLKRSGNSIPAMEKNILYKNPALKKIFSEAEFLWEAPQVISNISFVHKNQVADHVLLIGDAAGLITPLCGNGMSMSMHAGKLAFDAMDVFLKGSISRQVMEEQYLRQWKQHFRKRLWVGRQVQQLMGQKSTTALALKTLAAFPFLSKLVISATHGSDF
jgi:flavin-dependent dehydrogenase